MSQHYYSTTYKGMPVTVMMGWDRPLGYYFMIVELTENEDSTLPDNVYVYSNLNDATPFANSLDDYRKKLLNLGIVVPESMFVEVELDGMLNVGNRYVWHALDGSFNESEQ